MKNWIRWAVVGLVLTHNTLGYAALGTNLVLTEGSVASGEKVIRPVSTVTNWGTACDDASASDNSGSTVVNPGGITRSAQHKLQMGGRGTTVQIRLKYLTSGTVTQTLVVQAFGLDSSGAPQRLLDSTGTHAISVPVDTTNDARDGTYSYSEAVEVDAQANTEVIVTVKTPTTGTATTAIQVRIK